MVLGLPSLDYLLSLPFLSFFLLPASLSVGSWTTSLNFIFFYLTWITITWSHPPLAIQFFGTLAVRVVFYVVPCLLFLVLDTLLPSIAASFKSLGSRALPSRALRTKQYAVIQLMAFSLLNTVLGIALQTLIDYFLTKSFKLRSPLSVSMFLPTPWVVFKHLLFAYLVRNVLSYYVHANLLHAPQTSSILTQLHTTWQHGVIKTPLPFSAAYDHPAVYLLRVWLPTYAPLMVVRMHILSFWLFIALISLEEAFTMSGYGSGTQGGWFIMPSGVLLAGVARRQEAHFASAAAGKRGRVGNFAPWGVLDWIHGTQLPGVVDVVDDMRAEATKRNVKGKVNRAVDKATDRILYNDEDDEDEDEQSNEDASPASSEEKVRSSGGARRRTTRTTRARR